MRWTILLLYLLYALWSYRAQGQSDASSQKFYMKIDNHVGNETECSRDIPDCLSDPKNRLDCMCQVQLERVEEWRQWRQRCAENATHLFGSSGMMSNELGFCAQAFERLGYIVSLVNTSEGDGSYTYMSLSEKIAELKGSSIEYRKLLDRTIVGVYLRDNQQRGTCKEAYDEWLCATFLELYNNTNGTVEVAKPCLGVCTRVVQQCPYYLPSKFQRMDSTNNSRSDETIYGGYPAFDCPDEKILKYFKKHCSNCTVPYSLDGTCIGRAAALSVTSNYSILTVIVCLLSIVCYWGL